MTAPSHAPRTGGSCNRPAATTSSARSSAPAPLKPDAALARQGRYAQVADNLQVKEVNIGADDRFVICFNPDTAHRDAAVRTRLVAQLTDTIDSADTLTATKRAELLSAGSSGSHIALDTSPPWIRTTGMPDPCWVFSLTLLLDGTVLAAESGPTDLYDPATGTFTPTAPLPPDIHATTAVRLLDGRVLAVGGARGSSTAAQLYLPSTRTWQAAAGLNNDHFYAPWSQVLLADGRVLVVSGGGVAGCCPRPPFGEVWGPAAGFWTLTGPMANARSSSFGTVRLADGRVLVNGGAAPLTWCDDEGGDCYTQRTYTTEIYTP